MERTVQDEPNTPQTPIWPITELVEGHLGSTNMKRDVKICQARGDEVHRISRIVDPSWFTNVSSAIAYTII